MTKRQNDSEYANHVTSYTEQIFERDGSLQPGEQARLLRTARKLETIVSEMGKDIQQLESFMDLIRKKLSTVTSIDDPAIIIPLFRKIMETDDEDINEMLKDILVVSKLRFNDVEPEKDTRPQIGMAKLNSLRNIRKSIKSSE